MNLSINSPAYYTYEYGIIDEIYSLCRMISKNIEVSHYTDCLDIIGITPIIVPKEKKSDKNWKEVKKISTSYRMASISLHIDYDSFVNGDIVVKKGLIIDNIFNSLYVVKLKLKNRFDYKKIEKDIKTLLIKNNQL